MQLIRRFSFLIMCSFTGFAGFAQTDTTGPAVDPALLTIFDNRIPVEYTIAGIKVIGSDHFDNQLLISLSGLAVGDKVSIPGTDKFSKAVQNIWNQRYFGNVQIYFTKLEGKNLFVEIHVQERPVLSDFKFRGVKKSQADDLAGKVNLIKNRVITENMRRNAVEAIMKYFFEKGFPKATVKVTEVKDPLLDNANLIVFDVDRGPKVRIDQVNVFGNESVSELKIKKQLKGTKEMSKFTLFPDKAHAVYGKKEYPTFRDYVREKGFLSLSKTREFLDPFLRFKLFSNAKFSEKKFGEDKQRILEYYNSLGYRDAQLLADTQYYVGNNMNIDIKVQEGRKYYFGNIVWKGNTRYSDSILNLLLGINKGDIYNLELLEKRLGKKLTLEGGADISSLYVDDGYLFFSANPIETAVYNDTIDYEIRVTEGPEATIGQVKISGNDKTKEHVLRRVIRTVPAEKFRRSDLIRSQREIAALQFFDPEKIGVNYEPNQEKGTVDLSYSVVERSSDQLELSAGWGGGIGLTGTLGVVFNNFSIRNILNRSSWDPLPVGDGQKLSLRYQANGKFFHSYNFSFTEPWLGGKRQNSFTVGVFSTTYRNAQNQFGGIDKARGDTSYLKTFGVNIALGKQLRWPDDYFSLVYSLSYTRYKLRNYGNLFNLGNGQSLNNETSNNISFKIALNRNSAGPNPFFPTSGSNFALSAQFTPPYSLLNISSSNPYRLVEFHKWRFNGEWYVPIGKKHGDDGKQLVLKLAAKYGFIGRYTKNLEISPFERFQVGDAGLTNNFGILGYDIIAHRGYPIYETSDPRKNPDINTPQQFFTIFNKYVMELRYPFATNPNSTIYGLAFMEAANGWYSFKEYNPFRLRRSVGVGMRFYLPMFGLLGFDYGIGLDRFTGGQTGLKDAAKFTFMLGFEPE